MGNRNLEAEFYHSQRDRLVMLLLALYRIEYSDGVRATIARILLKNSEDYHE